MKYLIILLFILLSPTISAQDTTDVKVFSSALQMGEKLDFGAGSIKFKKVVSDSRCPRNVTCIWAGEAVVLVEVFKNGIFQKEMKLTVGEGEVPLDLLAEGVYYKFRNLVLLPYPVVDNTELPASYTLHVQLDRIAAAL